MGGWCVWIISVCGGIFCNMMRKEFSFTKNIPLYVFVVALLSTQSTTALSAFGVGVIIWLLINKKVKYAILLIPFILWVYSLPFVSEKAMTEYGNVVIQLIWLTHHTILIECSLLFCLFMSLSSILFLV